jgi:predicted nucleic acid-binding protein
VIQLDTSGLLAALDASQHQHQAAAEVLRGDPGPLLLSPFVLPELDFSLGIGLADASIVVLAARHGVREVLTLDERHFRALRDTRVRAFRLLPADRP